MKAVANRILEWGSLVSSLPDVAITDFAVEVGGRGRIGITWIEHRGMEMSLKWDFVPEGQALVVEGKINQ